MDPNLAQQNRRRASLHNAAKRTSGYPQSPTLILNQPATMVGHDEKFEPPRVSIIGFDKLADPNYNKAGKLFWFLALVVCSVICGHLARTHITRYFNYPIEQKVTLRNTDSITFPAITVCPVIAHFLLQKLGMQFSNQTDSVNRSSVDVNTWNEFLKRMNVSLYEYWDMSTIGSDAISIHTPCDSVSGDCIATVGKPIVVQNKTINTVWGNCLEIALSNPLPYRGPFTYLKLEVDMVKSALTTIVKKVGTSQAENVTRGLTIRHEDEMFGAMFYFHEEFNNTCQYDAFSQMHTLLKGYLGQVYLVKKQFQLLTTSEVPCTSRESVIDCWNSCTDRELNKVTDCKLPYMTSLLPECATVEQAFKTYIATYEVFSQTGTQQCGCSRACNSTAYTVSTDRTQRAHSNHSIVEIVIMFADNTEESVVEFYSYDLPTLFSDVGGILGLFMGVCILTLVEGLETLSYLVRHCVTKSRG